MNELTEAEFAYADALSVYGEGSPEAEIARWKMLALLPDEVLARHAALLAESGSLPKPVCVLNGCPVYDIRYMAEILEVPFALAAPALQRIVRLTNKHVTIH